MSLPSNKKGVCGYDDDVLAVKWNFKGGQLSWTGYLLQNFQIALTHLILKLKLIVIPQNQMSRSGEKHAQD